MELERWLVCSVWFSAEGQFLSLEQHCTGIPNSPNPLRMKKPALPTLRHSSVSLYLSIHQWKKNLHWIAIKLSSQSLPIFPHLPHFLQFSTMYPFISCLHGAYLPYMSLIQTIKRAKFTTELLRCLKLFQCVFSDNEADVLVELLLPQPGYWKYKIVY